MKYSLQCLSDLMTTWNEIFNIWEHKITLEITEFKCHHVAEDENSMEINYITLPITHQFWIDLILQPRLPDLKACTPFSDPTTISVTSFWYTLKLWRTSGFALNRQILENDLLEEMSINLPALLLLKPNHSASSTKGQPRSIASPAKPSQTSQERKEHRSHITISFHFHTFL